MKQNPTTTQAARVPDPEALRAVVRVKYTEVAADPDGQFHFHTGRRLAELLGYPASIRAALPDQAMASFAGVDNPFNAGRLPVGGRVVDLGSGGGFDCFVAAELVGPAGSVVGVDMTPATIDRPLLDIRRDNEFTAGHVPGATHVELGALATATVPAGPLVTMCGKAERATTGASVLQRAGHRDVAVLRGGFTGWTTLAGHEPATGV